MDFLGREPQIMKILKTYFPLFVLACLALMGCSSDDDFIPEPSSGFLVGKTVSEVTVGEDVQFNSSAANAESYFWDFGDGTKSEEKNPVKPFFESDIFTVTLTVENNGKSASFSQDITVLPFADFRVENADALSMEAEVQFTNLSQGADSFNWQFGDPDESLSSEESPSFNYSEDGAYTVTLTATGKGGAKVISKRVVIGEGFDGGTDPGDEVETPHEVYYIDYSDAAIQRIQMPGGTSADLVANISGRAGVGIAYDPGEDKIYFSDFEEADNGKIWRMNADGSGIEELVAGIDDPYSIALNLSEGKIYWGDDSGNISSANLDGTDLVVDLIHIDTGQMRGLAYDSKNDKIYFYEVNHEVIYMADSNGGNVQPVVEGTYGYGIYIDQKSDKVYYDDQRGSSIVRANLDGSNPEEVASVSDRIHGMGVDYHNDKFYWSERSNGVINRANLDGSEMENILSGLASPRGLFIK